MCDTEWYKVAWKCIVILNPWFVVCHPYRLATCTWFAYNSLGHTRGQILILLESELQNWSRSRLSLWLFLASGWLANEWILLISQSGKSANRSSLPLLENVFPMQSSVCPNFPLFNISDRPAGDWSVGRVILLFARPRFCADKIILSSSERSRHAIIKSCPKISTHNFQQQLRL